MKAEDASKRSRQDKKEGASDQAEIVIGGEKGIPHRMANCCSPKMGDRVVGYASRFGITIHRVDCGSLKKGTFDRFIPASWGSSEATELRMKVEMRFDNKMGVLRKLTDIFFLMRINILEISQKSEDGGKSARISFDLLMEDEDYYMYDRLVERIRLAIPEFKEAKLIEMR